MENERRTEYNVDMRPEEDFLSDILSASQIRATDTYETPPQIIWIDNSTIATLGNFSASTGKAKSKKTFNVSAIVAASLAGKQVLNYRAHLPEGKRKILYVDTEQSRFHCHNVLERILRLAGLPTTTDSENLDFICLREYSPAIRIGVIDYALRQRKGYGLVIIDGIRDLMLDINSTGESVEVINKMMEWSSKYDLHIHCVLHLNKGDNNVRGHIGTEMSNKAETVLVISKNNDCPNVSEVHALHIREKEFKPFAFTVNEGGLPVLAEGHLFENAPHQKPKQRTGFMELSIEQHREALSAAFGDKPIRGFENMLQAMMTAYEAIGFKRGRNVMVKLLQYLTDTLKLVIKLTSGTDFFAFFRVIVQILFELALCLFVFFGGVVLIFSGCFGLFGICLCIIVKAFHFVTHGGKTFYYGFIAVETFIAEGYLRAFFHKAHGFLREICCIHFSKASTIGAISATTLAK